MKKLFMLLGITLSTAILNFTVSAEQASEEEWILEQTVDEFGDTTGEAVFSYIVEGDFSNTATNSSLLKVGSGFYPNASAFGFKLYEYGNTLATYYDSSELTFKFKIDDTILDFKMIGSAPNGMLFLSDDMLMGDKVSTVLNNSSGSPLEKFKKAQSVEKTSISFEESGAQQLFHYLYNGNDLKCIIYIDNSKYNFTITANGFKDLYDEYAYNTGILLFNNGDFQNAAPYFSYVGDYKDSISYYEKCLENSRKELLTTSGLENVDEDAIKKLVEIFGAVYNGEELGEERVKYIRDHIHDLPMVDNDTEYAYVEGADKTALFPPRNLSGHEFFVYPINADYEYTNISYSINAWKNDTDDYYYEAKTNYKEVNGKSDKYSDGTKWRIEVSDGNLFWKSASSYIQLENGSSGEDVQYLQEALIDQGFLSGSADGVYGSGTASAVASFQNSKGLEKTGIADETTQRELFNDEDTVIYKDRLYKLYDGFYFVEHEEVKTGIIEYKLYGFKKPFGHLASYDDVIADLGILLE